MTVARSTQVALEAVSDATPTARVSQLLIESVSDATSKARVSQVVVEVVSGGAVVTAAGGQLIIAC